MLSVIPEVFRCGKTEQHENVASRVVNFDHHYFMPIVYMKYECYVIMLLDKNSDDCYLRLWNKTSSLFFKRNDYLLKCRHGSRHSCPLYVSSLAYRIN